jgi:molybdopterin-guanine dinucleotide biosynthesis protein A
MASAAILSGGRARRFDGRDKSRLLVGGRTILERQLEALRGTVVDRVWLVGYRGQVPPPPPLVALADRKPDLGPLAGLDAALAAEPCTAVLLLACDMPNVTSAFLGHLIQQLDDVDAVVPRTERGYHPLCAVYAQSCRAAVQRRLDEGHLRMQDLLADLRIRTVDGSELASFGEPDWLLANVNTRAALDALESQLNH